MLQTTRKLAKKLLWKPMVIGRKIAELPLQKPRSFHEIIAGQPKLLYLRDSGTTNGDLELVIVNENIGGEPPFVFNVSTRQASNMLPKLAKFLNAKYLQKEK